MKNKVLIRLIIPELDTNYDVFIPVNEVVWKIKRLLLKVVSDMSGFAIDQNLECILMNKNTCKIYDNNEIVLNTDIRNGTELLIISKL